MLVSWHNPLCACLGKPGIIFDTKAACSFVRRIKWSVILSQQWCIIALIMIYIIFCYMLSCNILTHWGWVMHIWVSKLTIIGSDIGLSPERRQSIIWTNAGMLLIGPLGINFSKILIKIQTFSLKKMHLKMLSAKRHPFCLGLNVLIKKYHLHETEIWWNLFSIHLTVESILCPNTNQLL